MTSNDPTPGANLPTDRPPAAGVPRSSSEAAAPSGRVLLDRYRLGAEIGRGGMGVVYAARDEVRDQEVAVKLVVPALDRDEGARGRFLREARIASELTHPNVVNVYDVQRDGDTVFITMELLEGRTLREEVAGGRRLEVRRVRRIAEQLCDALAYAHRTTVHRDVKPENVWVAEDGSIKLMDFGLATLGQHTTGRRSTPRGTRFYMAPEQARSRGGADHRADQYAVAATLYELLTGQVPTQPGRSPREVRRDVPRGLALAIQRALQAKPEERFADMRAFRRALSRPVAVTRGSVAAWVLTTLLLTGLLTSGTWLPQAREQVREMTRDRDAEAAHRRALAKTAHVLSQWEELVVQLPPEAHDRRLPMGPARLLDEAGAHERRGDFPNAIRALEGVQKLVAADVKLLRKQLEDRRELVAEAHEETEAASLSETAETAGTRELAILIEEGVSVHERGVDLEQAIHPVAQRGDAELLAMLLAHGADVNVLDADGVSPLHLAVVAGHVEVVRLLVEHGASIESRSRESHQRTPLLLAVARGDAGMVALLLALGADAGASDRHGECAAHLAARADRGDLIELLAGSGADLDQVIPHDSNAPLHLATAANSRAAVAALIAAGADLSAQDARGRTAYDIARAKGRSALEELLGGDR